MASSDATTADSSPVSTDLNARSAATTAAATTSGADIASATAPAASSSTSSSILAANASPHQSFFQAVQNDQGMVTVRSLDGYIVRAEGKDQAWSITGPDGKTTRIWGDPHVTESDGDTWDFKQRGTFTFGNNKATVEVVPNSKGQKISSRLTLYSGDERVTISGLDTNKPVISAVSYDGRQHDDTLADGVTYQRKSNQTGEAWTTKVGTKVSVMG
jgi:hypothetical protein